MTAGWTGTDMAAGDVAWHAWYRLGVRPFDVALGGETPPILEDLAAAIAPELDRVTRAVLDEAEVRLYGEARERVVATAEQSTITHVLWSVVEAVRRELMRPEPVPFSPPAAGAWIRARWPARQATGRHGPREATWDGLWHRFGGDLRAFPHHVNRVDGRTSCGFRVTLRDSAQDVAIADEMPGVDACRRCARAARQPVPA